MARNRRKEHPIPLPSDPGFNLGFVTTYAVDQVILDGEVNGGTGELTLTPWLE